MVEVILNSATGLRVANTYKENGNSICLHFIGSDGVLFRFRVYDWPAEITDKLVAAFADRSTTHYTKTES